MSLSPLTLLAICAVIVFLPPRWDPAIRIKEWQIRRGKHPESPAPPVGTDDTP